MAVAFFEIHALGTHDTAFDANCEQMSRPRLPVEVTIEDCPAFLNFAAMQILPSAVTCEDNSTTFFAFLVEFGVNQEAKPEGL